MRKIALLALSTLMPLSASADMISPTHNCARPSNPSQFATEGERASFQRQISAYKQCLAVFISEQERQVRIHSEAARKASDEMKRI